MYMNDKKNIYIRIKKMHPWKTISHSITRMKQGRNMIHLMCIYQNLKTAWMKKRLGKTEQIKTTQFLVGAGIPYYGVFLYLKKYFGETASLAYSDEDTQLINKLLKDYDEVYRQHNQLISWPVVQLYRNLLIAAVKTFVIDPMYRSLTFLPIFL